VALAQAVIETIRTPEKTEGLLNGYLTITTVDDLNPNPQVRAAGGDREHFMVLTGAELIGIISWRRWALQSVVAEIPF